MSKRPAPVAIISIAQHASPKVIGQSADLRAQLTTGAVMSIAFAPTVRRTEFMIESTVVRTNPSSCSAIELRDEGGGIRDDCPDSFGSLLVLQTLGHADKHRNEFICKSELPGSVMPVLSFAFIPQPSALIP